MILMEYAWYFAIYSFIGWIFETIYLLVKHKKFINSGFLKGPVCPLYGTCAVIFIFLLSPLKNNLVIFFILATLIATFFEYLIALILEMIFKIKFWDYSDYKFNLHGRIAPLVSLAWGILSLILIKIVHPQISPLITSLSESVLTIGVIFIVLYFLTDLIYTTISLFGLKKILKKIDDISSNIDEFRHHQLHFFKAFPNLNSTKYRIIEEVKQKIKLKL